MSFLRLGEIKESLSFLGEMGSTSLLYWPGPGTAFDLLRKERFAKYCLSLSNSFLFDPIILALELL